jgi:general secretion pathway protein F
MPAFAYQALDAQGQRLMGTVSAASEQAVLAELESRRLTPITIAQATAPRRALSLRRRVGPRALATSYQQLADLLRSGVPLLRALKLLAKGRASPRLAEVYKHLAEAVEQGRDLADAMADKPETFPPVHAAMIRAGEKGGFLEPVAARLAQLVGNQADLRAKVLGNLIYPVLLIVFGVLILGVVFGLFVPMFRPILAQIPQLPFITRIVFALSDLIAGWGWLVPAILIPAGILAWRASRTPTWRRRLAHLQTTAPILGPLTRSLAAARFCRMLGTMLANGIPMLSAMKIAKQAAGNALMEDAIDRATESVRAGKTLAEPLRESGLFADDVIEMIDVAESANNLDHVLLSIADTVESRIDRLLGSLVRLIEPILLLAIALVVALIAIALILPMTQFKTGL